MAQSGIFLLNTQQVQIPLSSTSFTEQIQIPSLFYDQIRHIPRSYKASLIDLKSALLLRLKNLREPFFFTGKEKKNNLPKRHVFKTGKCFQSILYQ